MRKSLFTPLSRCIGSKVAGVWAAGAGCRVPSNSYIYQGTCLRLMISPAYQYTMYHIMIGYWKGWRMPWEIPAVAEKLLPQTYLCSKSCTMAAR